MRLRGATIWIVLAGLLGALLVWIRATPGGGERFETFPLGLDSASVIGLRVQKADGTSESVTRDADGLWVLQLINTSGENAVWPVDDSMMRGGIRLLASSVFVDRDSASESLNPLCSLVITMRGGVETEILFESRGIGGRVPVRVRTGNGFRAGWAQRSMLDTYLGSGVRTGLSAWRDRSIAETASQADSLVIEALGERVVLRKTIGRWVLQEPVTIEANAAVVEAVISAMSSLEIERFLEAADPSDAAYGLADPVGKLEIGWAARGTSGRERSVRIVLGSLAEATGEVLHALVTMTSGDQVFGPRLVTIRVPEFPDSTVAYLRTRATPLSVTDLRGISVRRRADSTPVATFSRTIDGWTTDGEPDRDGVGQSIVDFVCTQRAIGQQFVTTEQIQELPGYLGEIGIIVGGGVEAEIFAVALPTEQTPTLRLVGADLTQGTHVMWSFNGPAADRLVSWFIDWFGL